MDKQQELIDHYLNIIRNQEKLIEAKTKEIKMLNLLLSECPSLQISRR